MQGKVVTIFNNYLIGVKPFSDVGCISIFHPHQGGVTIHHYSDVQIKYLAPLITKGVREKAGLRQVPLTNNTTHDLGLPNTTGSEQAYLAHDTPTAQANNLYELTSIYQGINCMHAVCRYPVNSTWLKGIRAGNYLG